MSYHGAEATMAELVKVAVPSDHSRPLREKEETACVEATEGRMREPDDVTVRLASPVRKAGPDAIAVDWMITDPVPFIVALAEY